MKKFVFKSRTVKVTFEPNLNYSALYRNAIVVGKLHREYTRSELLLFALSVNKPFRKCHGVGRLTITILNDKCYNELRSIAMLNFPFSYVN